MKPARSALFRHVQIVRAMVRGRLPPGARLAAHKLRFGIRWQPRIAALYAAAWLGLDPA